MQLKKYVKNILTELVSIEENLKQDINPNITLAQAQNTKRGKAIDFSLCISCDDSDNTINVIESTGTNDNANKINFSFYIDKPDDDEQKDKQLDKQLEDAKNDYITEIEKYIGDSFPGLRRQIMQPKTTKTTSRLRRKMMQTK